ncbi:MAG: mRNA-capping enzyme subunit beta [Phylliscum demangeonii]|nr:MAG: mRNA-capping enzyme subunit beta [Phylliscum demangeonii]
MQISEVKREASSATIESTSAAPRAKKRRRREEPPIFARSVHHATNESLRASSRRQPAAGPGTGGASTSAKSDNKDLQPLATQLDASAQANKDSAGPSSSSDTSILALPLAQPRLADDGPLGPWEPSITNIIPYEEVTRAVMDFLFMEVVERRDVGAGPTGASASHGAHLEIEAKLGHLIDKNTNERVRLPISTECVFNQKDGSWRTAFRSSMTESQHRVLNQYLNKAVVHSKQLPGSTPTSAHANGTSTPSKARIPMDYVHTRERDRFYDLPAAQLPSLPLSVRPALNNRHRTRVRVTTDQKTGEPLAQIVKIRLADLDVYSPRTAFDWRLSVNLETAFDGDVSHLIEIVENGRRSERLKDRMTYKHLAYQIDLTQVTMASDDQGTAKPGREHELEVEVSAERIREQGLLAKTGQVTQYEDLIKGFIDNVRTLARVVHPT